MSASIQDVKDFWDSRPCNIGHSVEPVGSRTYFEEVERRKRFVEPHIEQFADFDRWEGKSVLEVGCGMGTDGIRFAQAGALYTGIELSSTSLELAKKRFDLYGLNGRLLVQNAEELSTGPLAGHSYDLIYSFGVLHHTVSPERAIKELRLMCHSSTELRIMLYARNSWKAALISSGLDQPEAQADCPIALTYSREEATTLLESCGFSITRMEQAHIFPWEVESYVRHQYIKQPWFAAMPAEIYEAMEKELGWHLLIRATPV